MSGHCQRRKAIRFTVVALSVATIALPTGADAGTKPVSSFAATPLVAESTITAAKSASGRLATTDSSLLGRTDSTPINVVVKLDYDATASYTGDISGLAATSPRVTGRKLTGKSGAEQAYSSTPGTSTSPSATTSRPPFRQRRRARACNVSTAAWHFECRRIRLPSCCQSMVSLPFNRTSCDMSTRSRARPSSVRPPSGIRLVVRRCQARA